MNKGDLFTVLYNGAVVTICVVGTYLEEFSGEEMAILAIVTQENIVHMPVNDLDALFPGKKYIN